MRGCNHLLVPPAERIILLSRSTLMQVCFAHAYLPCCAPPPPLWWCVDEVQDKTRPDQELEKITCTLR
jgi:hypothetical protein